MLNFRACRRLEFLWYILTPEIFSLHQNEVSKSLVEWEFQDVEEKRRQPGILAFQRKILDAP